MAAAGQEVARRSRRHRPLPRRGWLAFALRIGDWDVIPIRLATFEVIALAAWLGSAVATNPYRAVGQPVRILDLARAMIELTGLSVVDEKNI